MQIRSVQWQDGRFGYPYDSPEGRASLDKLKQSIPSRNYVHLDVRVRCADGSNSADPDPDTTLDELIAAVTYAKSLGYKILIRIRLRGVTSMTFAPPDIGVWFANYRNAILYWAEFCKDYGVNHFCIGNELSAPLTLQNDTWAIIVSDVRQVFRGTISYSVNWWYMREDNGNVPGLNTLLAATWLGLLDYIGLSSYPNLVTASEYPPSPDTISVELLIARYQDLPLYNLRGESLVDHYGYLSDQHGKKLIFYIGIASFREAMATPWLPWSSGLPTEVDLEGQANWHTAFYELFGRQPYTAGISLDGGWQTNPDKTPNNLEFTVMNKPAESVVQYYFSILTPTSLLGQLLPFAFVGGLLYLTGDKSRRRG